jgi:Family of unknown function (DUF5994)
MTTSLHESRPYKRLTRVRPLSEGHTMTATAAPRGSTSTLPASMASGAAAPPPTPAQRPRRAGGRARLSLNLPGARQAGLRGGWWPHSPDATAELPGLVAELSTQAGRVSRVALQADAFTNIPRKLDVGGRKVPVGWFRYMNKHTAIVTMAGRDDLVLLVIPPWASPAAAAEALALAASARRAGPPEAILAAAGIAGDLAGHRAAEAQAADLLALARLDDDGAPCAGALRDHNAGARTMTGAPGCPADPLAPLMIFPEGSDGITPQGRPRVWAPPPPDARGDRRQLARTASPASPARPSGPRGLADDDAFIPNPAAKGKPCLSQPPRLGAPPIIWARAHPPTAPSGRCQSGPRKLAHT